MTVHDLQMAICDRLNATSAKMQLHDTDSYEYAELRDPYDRLEVAWSINNAMECGTL